MMYEEIIKGLLIFHHQLMVTSYSHSKTIYFMIIKLEKKYFYDLLTIIVSFKCDRYHVAIQETKSVVGINAKPLWT